MSQPQITIYTTRYCPYCHAAKALLSKKGVSFDEIDVSDPDLRQKMTARANGRRTVPQIFIGDTHVGGCDDLHELDERGQLDPGGYLAVVTELLMDDLDTLVKAWRPGSKLNYRSRFVEGGQESLRKIFVGLGSLSRGELAGERLEVALNSQDQEDEHSCFSDNTHRDAVTDALGIENVWLGRYKRADGTLLQGPSPRDLVMARDAGLAEKTSKQIAASVAAASAIQAPFDREIVGAKDAPGRLRVKATIDSLVQQSKDLVAAANAIGISKLTLVQP